MAGGFIQSCNKRRRREWTFIFWRHFCEPRPSVLQQRDTFDKRSAAAGEGGRGGGGGWLGGGSSCAPLSSPPHSLKGKCSCWESLDCCDVLTASRQSTKDFGVYEVRLASVNCQCLPFINAVLFECSPNTGHVFQSAAAQSVSRR